VKAGQLLALISTPEVDQRWIRRAPMVLQAAAALQQSRASVQQSQANLELARTTRDRYLL
jgi:multidrug resistance efflux pump